MLYCFISSTYRDWDVLIPAAKFTLNLTSSASTGYSPTFVLNAHESILPFEHAISSLVNITDASIVDHP